MTDDPFRRQTIETWVSDFADSTAFAELTAPAKEYAAVILPAFLGHACKQRDVTPADLEESDLKPALLEGVAALELPASVRAEVPDLCAALLADLEARGRLGGGASLGRYVRALRAAYSERTAETVAPIRNPGAKIGRNDPCPCGSGRKFKRCCMGK